MAIYIYPREQRNEVAADIQRAGAQSATHMGVGAADFRQCVRSMLHHRVLLLPAQVAQHTPEVERMKQVALICGMDVQPITSYKRNKPAPAPAARHTQQSAGAGIL